MTVPMRAVWILIGTAFSKDAQTSTGALDRVVRRSRTNRSDVAENPEDVPQLSESGKMEREGGAHDLPKSRLAKSGAGLE